MTDNKHVAELNRAADRLADVTNELSEVLERLVKSQRKESQEEDGARMQPRPKVPLLTGGKDPTLAERFEEELAGRNSTREEARLVERNERLKPSSKNVDNLREWAMKAREINERLAAQGRYFGDSTEIIRADRDSRV